VVFEWFSVVFLVVGGFRVALGGFDFFCGWFSVGFFFGGFC